MRASDWRHHAACQNEDRELFFPGKGDVAKAEEAKRICRQCPVQAPCLEHALNNREDCGVWGGTTEAERDRIRRKKPQLKRQLVPCGTESAYHRHIRRREPPCEPCKVAVAAAQRDRHARRKVTAS